MSAPRRASTDRVQAHIAERDHTAAQRAAIARRRWCTWCGESHWRPDLHETCVRCERAVLNTSDGAHRG